MLKTDWQNLKKGDVIYQSKTPRRILAVTKNAGVVLDNGAFYALHHFKRFVIKRQPVKTNIKNT